MNALQKLIKNISIKTTVVHIVAFSFAMLVVWGTSYLILSNFLPDEPDINPSYSVYIPPKDVGRVANDKASSTIASSTLITTAGATSSKQKK